MHAFADDERPMSTSPDPWGLDDEVEAPPATGPAPGPEPELSAPVRCVHCGEMHSTCAERAAELLRSRIRAESRERLARLERVIADLGEPERIALARWLQAALDRPPLVNGRLEYVRVALDALWRDIYYLTPDPLSPSFTYGGEMYVVPEPHHELAEMRDDEWVSPL